MGAVCSKCKVVFLRMFLQNQIATDNVFVGAFPLDLNRWLHPCWWVGTRPWFFDECFFGHEPVQCKVNVEHTDMDPFVHRGSRFVAMGLLMRLLALRTPRFRFGMMLAVHTFCGPGIVGSILCTEIMVQDLSSASLAASWDPYKPE